MAITKQQAVAAIQQNGERFNMNASDFNDGDDDAALLSTGQVGEIGEAQVGSDNTFADYSAVMVGQPARESGMTAGNELYINLGGTTDNSTTQIAFGIRKRGDPGFTKRNNASGWMYQRNTNATDRIDQVKLGPTRPLARDGRFIIFAVQDTETAPQVDLTDCVLEVPAVGGDI